MRQNIQRAIFFLAAVIVIYLTNTGSVFADGTSNTSSNCVPVYGGGVSCPRIGQVLINKTVKNPSTGVFVDNLGPSDPRFRPESLVTFHLAVQNTGDQTLDKVTVTDTLPDFLDFTSGPGNFDSKSKTLTFDVFNLAGGTSQTFEMLGRVVHEAVLPADKSLVCVVNNVTAVTSSQTDSDSSQVCITKEAPPVVPTAGPKEWVLTIVGLSTGLTLGLYLRKKSIVG